MTAPMPVARARSFLFVPGNRPERFDKAVRSGADAVVLDLEDAVPPAAKALARQAVAEAWPALRQSRTALVIRINAPASDAGRADLAAIRALAGLDAVMVPKAEDAATLQQVADSLPGVALIPLIETALGYVKLNEVAAVAATLRLAAGHIDFMADTGLQCSDGEPELDALRFAIAMATRVNRLSPAIDGVTLDIHSVQQLQQDTRRSVRFGFGAKLCIHPQQVAPVHEALRPAAAEAAWAQRVVDADAASGGAAVQLDGRMVDAPVVLQARRILARMGAP